MLKVLIVDDEILARVGIKSFIAWKEHDFEIVGECDNGGKAFLMAKDLKPDIIITDVKMPIMSGIELMKALKNEGVEVKFIMLSSYDDFNLVKEAMKEGAEDYILKLQMESEDLLKVLDNVRKKIYSENNLKKKKDYIDIQIPKDILALKEKFLRNLIYGNRYTEKEIKEYLNLYNINLPTENVVCHIVRICEEAHNTFSRDHIFKDSITNIISESICNYANGQVVYCESNIYAMICSLNTYNNINDMNRTVDRMTKSIKEFIKNSMNVSIAIGISKIYSGFNFIRQAYLEANEAISYQFSCTEGGITFYRDIEHGDAKFSNVQLNKEMNEVASSLKSNCISLIKPAFKNYTEDLKASTNLSEKDFIGNSHILVFIVNEFIKNNNLYEKDIWGDDENHYFQVSRMKARKDYIHWIEEIQNNIIKVLEQENESSTIILRAKQFVHLNISKNISLKIISDYLGFSPSYFSRLFSQVTGQCFIDYVTQEKINLASNLIKSSNKKIYEIAETVGYDNVHYFSRVFKKTTGVSPMKYKTGNNNQ